MGLQEAQGGVVEDVIIRAADAVLRGPQEEVTVVAPALPPLGQVRRRLAELEALGQQRVREDLLSDAAQQLDAVQGARGALLGDRVDDQSRVWEF